MEQCRVPDEGLRVVNGCSEGRTMTVPQQKGVANSVPAAAVIQRPRALTGFIGRKAYAGCLVSHLLNLQAQPGDCG